MRIESLSKIETVRTRLSLDHLLNRVRQALTTAQDIRSELAAWLPELLRAFHATNIGLRIGPIDYLGGPGRQAGPANAVLDEVGQRADAKLSMPRVAMWEDMLAEGRDPLACLPDAAGLLLAEHHDNDINFCFATRPEVVQQVRWGGRPQKHAVRVPEGRVRLEPR